MLWPWITLLLFSTSISCIANALSCDTTLILNKADIPGELPRNFRTTSTPFLDNSSPMPNLEGLKEMRISGSGQFSNEGLEAISRHLNGPECLIVIDLREESHGFINGNAVSWFIPKGWSNVGKPITQIVREEDSLLSSLLNEEEVIVQKIIKKTFEGAIESSTSLLLYPDRVQNERDLVQAHNFKYFRLPVTDHTRPSNVIVEKFLHIVQDLPVNSWVHFHCSAGDGRTTTFMTMFDMLQNSKKVSLKDILQRQTLLGGKNLIHLPPENSYKFKAAQARLEFIQEFYKFSQSSSTLSPPQMINES